MTAVCIASPGVDPARWPDVATVPHAPVRAALTRRLTRLALSRLPLRVTTVAGDRFGAGGPTDPGLHLARPDAFYRRVGTSGLIGFGEAYMAGDWHSDDLVGVLTVLAAHADRLVPAPLQRLRRLVLPARPTGQDNTPDGARRNIARHYDLPVELFGVFLDQTLTYSAALFAADPPDPAEPLAAAQHRKIDRILDLAGVTTGSRLLEIGTGWGELAVRAAARGAVVTTVTLSAEQARLAQARIAAAGYAERVRVQLADYRHIVGSYDALVSVEMIEAVGGAHWEEYFKTIGRLLAPGGRAAIQAIVMPHRRMLATADTYTWIVKYIFPGGQAPSLTAIADCAGRAGLRTGVPFRFGAHYAETLRRWRHAFTAHGDRVDRFGLDDTFRAMWTLYLAYSEAGFRAGYLDVAQLELTKPGP